MFGHGFLDRTGSNSKTLHVGDALETEPDCLPTRLCSNTSSEEENKHVYKHDRCQMDTKQQEDGKMFVTFQGRGLIIAKDTYR